MEYFIVIIAAMLAGIGTGLVGLSAATAMVPLLIVLCPTFQGEHGAYMAVFCKPFLDKIAKYFWTLLQVHFGQSCKALASLK